MENQNSVEAGREHRAASSAEMETNPTLNAAPPSQECEHETYRSLCPECSDLS